MQFIKRNSLPLLISVFFAVLYIHNLSHGVYAGDTGDFISSAIVGGVPHAPGYPLFILLGFLLTRFSFWPTPAFAVGLISAFSGAIALFFFFKLAKKLSSNSLISFIVTLTLGFSYFFWFYSEIAEVFALNSLFAIILIYLSVLFNEKPTPKKFFLLSLVAGFSATNHQTIVLIFPALLIIIFNKKCLNLGFIKNNIKNILISMGFLILGFSVYIYVPIASHFNPPINWDNVVNVKSFLHLLLRVDYGTFSAGNIGNVNIYQKIIILQTYLYYMFVQLTPPVIVMSIIGLIYLLFLKKIKLAVSFLLGFIISGPLFVTYAGFPLTAAFYLGVYERFFILSGIFICLFFIFGLLFLYKLFKYILSRETSVILCLSIFLFIPLMLFIYNFPKTDLSNNNIGNNLGYDSLSYLPKNSIVLLGSDTQLFNAWYIHYGLNFRPDLRIVNFNGLSTDPYFNQKIKRYKSFHRKDNVVKIINGTIMDIEKKHQIFSFTPINITGFGYITWVPYGILYKLEAHKITEFDFKKEVSFNWLKIDKSISLFSSVNSKIIGNYSLANVPDVYAQSMLATGNYFYTLFSDKERANAWYKLAIQIDPTFSNNYQVLGFFDMVVNKNCLEAEKNINKALVLNQFDQTSYYLLYIDQAECLKNINSANKTALRFSNLFKYDFYKAFKEELKKYKK